MNSQDTIEDPTLYQDMLPAIDSNESNEAVVIEDDPHSVQSVSHTLESPPEKKKVIRDDDENKERMRGQPRHMADSALNPKLERVLLCVTQLDLHLTQLKERVEEMANSIKHIVTCLEELKDDLRNDFSKTKDSTQRRQQEKGILKRVKGQRDDGYQPIPFRAPLTR
ncbi:hypothetical protein EJ07DRAFT_168358 [Lizonia empirigonia]|nr:hypothetical protein EJ07DRAFT_168358 [Lizonia empirigonia]